MKSIPDSLRDTEVMKGGTFVTSFAGLTFKQLILRPAM